MEPGLQWERGRSGLWSPCQHDGELTKEVMGLAQGIGRVPLARPAWGHLQPQCRQGSSAHPTRGHPQEWWG